MPFRTCSVCGRPFEPTHYGQHRCPEHHVTGRAGRSPTTQAQDAQYRAERKRVLAGGPHLCHWGCGRVATTADHVIPVARGGGHRGNLVPACGWCNGSKGDRDAPRGQGMPADRTPRAHPPAPAPQRARPGLL